MYGKPKAEVQQKIKQLLAEAKQGRDLGAPRKTLAQFLTYWLEEVIKPHRRASTYRMYEQVIRCYITHTWAITSLRSSPPQAKAFLAAAHGHRLAPLYHLALYRGLREGELLTLRWSDVSLDTGTLRVADAKTPAGERTIPLGPDLVRMLRDHWAWLQEERLFEGVNWREHGLVFPTSLGTPMSARNLVRHFKSVLKKAGLPDIRFHDLRHSCASLLAAEGTPPAVAMRILGHAQVSTTLEIYTHADLAAMQEWLTRLDDALRA